MDLRLTLVFLLSTLIVGLTHASGDQPSSGFDAPSIHAVEKELKCSTETDEENNNSTRVCTKGSKMTPSFTNQLARIDSHAASNALASFRKVQSQYCDQFAPISYSPNCYKSINNVSPYLIYTANGSPRYVYQSNDFNQVLKLVSCKKSFCYPYRYGSLDFRVHEADTLAVQRHPFPQPYPAGHCYTLYRPFYFYVWDPTSWPRIEARWEKFYFAACCKCRIINWFNYNGLKELV